MTYIMDAGAFNRLTYSAEIPPPQDPDPTTAYK